MKRMTLDQADGLHSLKSVPLKAVEPANYRAFKNQNICVYIYILIYIYIYIYRNHNKES